MKFSFEKGCNLDDNKVYYGIVRDSEYLPFGVYPMKLDEISYDNEVVVFEYTERHLIYFSTVFQRVNDLVFELEDEAYSVMNSMEGNRGMSISVLG